MEAGRKIDNKGSPEEKNSGVIIKTYDERKESQLGYKRDI